MLKSRTLFCLALASATFAAAKTFDIDMPAQDSDGCYEISTADELYGFSSIVNSVSSNQAFTGCAKLTKDIVVNENVLTAEGELNEESMWDFATWSPMMRFAGTFDGQGHVISGLYVNRTTSDNSAFIGSIQTPSRSLKDTVYVKNLGIVDSYFGGRYGTAALVGEIAYDAWPAVIENCFTNSRVAGSSSNAGGIAGIAYDFQIRNCYNLGNITGTERVGGIVGYTVQKDSRIINSYNAGNVTATSTPIYGKPIVGYAYNSITHENVFYLSDILEEGDIDTMGVAMTGEQFEKGAVAYLLRNYSYETVDASLWGQKIGTESYPTFSGTLTGAPAIDVQTLTLHTYEGDTGAYPKDYAPGYMLRLPQSYREGYTFHGWFDNAELTGDSIAVIPASATEPQEFWARYKKAWTITYKLDGGVIDSNQVDSYTETIGAKLPKSVSRMGYVFAGWYAASDFSGHAADSVRTSDTGDKVFYAKWFKKETPKQDEDGCYEISSAAELYGFSALVKGTDGIKTPQTRACGKLTKDVVVNKLAFDEDGAFDETYIADYIPWNPIDSFAGRFDGQGHTVSGLFYDDTVHYWAHPGLFGTIGAIADRDTVVIRNVGVEKSFLRALSSAGGIVAGTGYAGTDGLVLIENCYNAATVTGIYSDIGGIIGVLSGLSQVHIVNCYNVGTLRTGSNVGGIVGWCGKANIATLVNCFGMAPTSTTYKGYNKALVSGNSNYTIRYVNSYYLETSGNREYGGYSVTAEQVKNGALAYALRYGSYEGYNGLAWGQDVGTDEYPVLSGELKNSEAVPYKVTFNTFEGDTAKYFDSYMPGIERPLPDTVVMEKGTFLGWYADADFSGDALKMIAKNATGDQEFYAKIYKISDVTYVLNGGKIDADNVTEYTEGVGAQLPWRVSRDSCIFAGWYDNEELSGKPVTEITTDETGDKTYYAAWFKMKMPELDEADACYAISDAAELYGFAAFVGAKHNMSRTVNHNICGKLTQDIVINEGVLKDGVLDSANMTTFLKWEPISLFGGDFYGNGHKISGLYISRDSTAQGFIANLDTRYDKEYNQIPIVVRDVSFEDSYVMGFGEVGGVVGTIMSYRSFTMINVRFDGIVGSKISGYNTSVAGGLIGKTFATLVLDSCVNMAAVSAKAAGGLIGDNVGPLSISNSANLGAISGGADGAGGFVVVSSLSHEDKITNSYNAGTVTSTGRSAGLIVSPRATSMSISNSYNTGEIVGSGSAGGLVGGAETALSILQCYNTGYVRATANSSTVGGLVASISNKSSIIANSYNAGNVWAHTYFGKAAGLVGSVGTSGSETTLLLNNHFSGTIEQAHDISIVAGKNNANTTLQAENIFYLAVEGKTSDIGNAASAEAFANDSVASLLHAYVQKDGEGNALEGGIKGTAWIQGEKYPELLTKTIFAIAFVLDGGTLENAPVSYEYGEGLTLPTPKREGYEFKGWFEDRFLNGEAVTEISAKDRGDKVFYAKWQVKVYQVTVQVNNSKWGMVTGLKNDGKYNYDATVSLKAEPNQGYVLSYWGDDIESNSASIGFKVKGDTTIVANFAPINPESSSSSEESSSSAKSSSSEKSSSSSAKSSSSKEQESSSSECKGKDCKDAVPAIAAAPMFRVEAVSRMVHVSGARAGAAYALFDPQGRVLRSGRVGEANFSVPVPTAGLYLVRVGGRTLRVGVK